MGESHHQATTSSRLGIRSTGSGDIVEVRGHIVRSTGRKDRHSKVCTAKGPRDRRVRLAAHTAIQFYDVQDRLGYDRPSKAVDWLIKKAKAAIDELDELPAWNPTSTTSVATTTVPTTSVTMETSENASTHPRFAAVDTAIASGSRRTATTATMVGSSAEFQNPNNNSSNFLPASLDSDSIADTIKSFFPMGAAAAEAPSSTIQFHQNFPPDLLSRTSSQSQDLRLSLQSFQDPMLLHHHQTHQTHQNEQTLFGFDGSSAAWSEHHQEQQQQQAEINRFQRMVAWNNAGADTGNGGGAHSGSAGGFIFNSVPISQTSLSPSPPPLQPLLFGQSQSQFFSSQRGPLQSSNTPSIRAWMDQHSISDHQISQPSIHHHHSSSISGMGFASGGFSGFHIPARIQGEEEHDGISDKPSSASSNSRH